MWISLFFFYVDGDHRDLHVLTHSFPTRRFSDLYEGQDANVTESAETVASETGAQATQPGTPMAGAEGAAAMVGQAGETVVVTRPAPGQTVEIQAAAGQTYVLSFPPGPDRKSVV